jgi:transposase
MPYKHNESRRHKFKKAGYRVKNWPEYDKALKQRGSLTIWFSEEAIAAWCPVLGVKQSGGQRVYADLAIETALTLRSVYHLALRQTEGLLESLARLLDLDIPIPDHTTLSRRSRDLNPAMFRRMPGEAVCILVDSTGLKISGTGEWEETKHGLSRRRCWKKLHLAIDESNGEILAATLTTHLEDDASQVGPLLDQIDGQIDSVIADGAYDTRAVYSLLEEKCIAGIFPPRRDAVLSSDAETSPTTRDRNILMIQEKGRMAWQKETGYQRRSMVENGMFRYKKIIGGSLRSRDDSARKTEILIGVAILNRMNGLGSVVSVKE